MAPANTSQRVLSKATEPFGQVHVSEGSDVDQAEEFNTRHLLTHSIEPWPIFNHLFWSVTANHLFWPGRRSQLK